MKRLIVFCLLIAGLFSAIVFKPQTNPLFSIDGVEKVCFVANEKFENLENVNCGDYVFNYCSLQTAKENLEEFQKKSKAVQVYYHDVSLEEVLNKLKANVVSEENIENIKVVVAYTPYVQDCVFVKNKKANLQLAEKDGKLIAGFPAILTGF